MSGRTTTSTAMAYQSNTDRRAVIACMMFCIWRVHWKVVFQDHGFFHGEVVTRARLLLRRIHRENMLSSYILKKDNL